MGVTDFVRAKEGWHASLLHGLLKTEGRDDMRHVSITFMEECFDLLGDAYIYIYI